MSDVAFKLAVRHIEKDVFNFPLCRITSNMAGKVTHQVSIEIGSTKGKSTCHRWLLWAFRKRLGQNMAFKLRV